MHRCASAIADGPTAARGSNLKGCHKCRLARTYVTWTLDCSRVKVFICSSRFWLMRSRAASSGLESLFVHWLRSLLFLQNELPDQAGVTLCVHDRNRKTQLSDRCIFGWALVIVLIIAVQSHVLVWSCVISKSLIIWVDPQPQIGFFFLLLMFCFTLRFYTFLLLSSLQVSEIDTHTCISQSGSLSFIAHSSAEVECSIKSILWPEYVKQQVLVQFFCNLRRWCVSATGLKFKSISSLSFF